MNGLIGILVAGVLVSMPANTIVAKTTATCEASQPAVTLLTEDQLAKPFILVGELHGNNESPAFTAALVCRLTQSGYKVLLAVEAPENVQLPLNQHEGRFVFHNEADGLSESYWYMENPHGRTTPAMVKMIRDTTNIAPIVFVDVSWPWRGKPVGNRDEWMATGLQKQWQTGKFDRIVFHGGNFHTRLSSRDNKSHPSIPDYLPAEDVVSINIGAAGGKSWACLGDAGCGPHDFGRGDPITSPLVETVHDINSLPYSIMIRVPKFTPSYPLGQTQLETDTRSAQP